MLAIVDAVPMVMQCPFERCMQDSAAVNSSCAILPPRTSSDICHTPVPEPICLPRKCPTTSARRRCRWSGMSQLAAPISSDGVVLSQPMSSTTPSMRIAADGFFDVHAGEIAEQHRGGPQLRLAQRHHGKLERESAGFVDPALHELRELAEVAVAGSELAPGVADADDGTAVEQVVRIALVLDPAAVNETVLVLLARTSPGCAAVSSSSTRCLRKIYTSRIRNR